MIGQPLCDELAGRAQPRDAAFNLRQRNLAKPTVEHFATERLR
jgi:hypothetical protein